MNAIIQDLKSLWSFRQLCLRMSIREVQSRYAGTAAGILWVYLPPILTMATYYLVFDIVFNMRLGENAPARTVGVYMIAGMLPWITFADAISRGMNSLLEAGSALQKNPLPPVLFLTRVVVASGIVFVPLLIILYVSYGGIHEFSFLSILSFVFLILLQGILCWLIAYSLALLAAAVRDTIQIIGFILSIGIFVSPVLFQISMFPEKWQWILWINPMTSFIIGYQDALLLGKFADKTVWLSIFLWIAGLSFFLNLAIIRTREELIDWI